MEAQSTREVLEGTRVIAIVGVSDKPDRPSNRVAQYLLDHGDYQLLFINPALDQLFGQPVYSTLTEAAGAVRESGIDIVDVFRKVEDMGPILDEAIAIRARTFWMQLGLSSDELAARGELAGLTVVQDKCIKIELENR